MPFLKKSSGHLGGTDGEEPNPPLTTAILIPNASNATPGANPATTLNPNPTLAAHKNRKPVILQPNGLAQPSVVHFDPWNSGSTGHQRAENRLSGSTSWRDSRNHKLGTQYRSGLSGGRRVADTAGAGSVCFGKDGRKVNGGWERGARGLRTGGQLSLWEAVGHRSKVGSDDAPKQPESMNADSDGPGRPTEASDEADPDQLTQPQPPKPAIFTNLTFYINGSTAPLISDHRLKRLIAEHGGRLSIGLARRAVTHVVLGSTHARGGAGGGLAATKIQKEVLRVRGKGVKFVGAEWVVECVRLGKRVSEATFAPAGCSTAPVGQRSVLGCFGVSKNAACGEKVGKENG